MKLSKALASMLLTLIAISAQANIISVIGGDTFTAPNNNDFVAGDEFNIGGNLFLNFDAELTFTYLGHEAGYNNDFFAFSSSFGSSPGSSLGSSPGSSLGSSLNLNNKSNLLGDSVSGIASAGIIDFGFFSNNVNAGVINGNNQPFAAAQSFAIMTDYIWTDGTAFDAVLFFDDSGANRNDDHDDHIIGLNASQFSVVQASEPAIIALVALGLFAVYIAKRRKV